MRILHLLSNWKWTERSEPAAELALAEQHAGHDVVFACARPPMACNGDAAARASELGIRDVRRIVLPKHLSPWTVPGAGAAIRKLVEDFRPDVVHAHMRNAHLLAALAGVGRGGARLVRSVYEPDGLPSGLRERLLAAFACDGVVAITARAAMSAVRAGVPFRNVAVIEPGIDVARFAPRGDRKAARESFGLPADGFVVGVVSRIREARRIDLAIDAVALAAAGGVNARLLVCGRGRGDAVDRIVLRPAAAAGIGGRVVAAGYCRGERLVDAYTAMDVLVYPAHGTDPSCRTVREAMAAGVAVVASRRGFAIDLIAHGVTGMLVEPDAAKIASALVRLSNEQARLASIRGAAAEAACTRFSNKKRASKSGAFYRQLCAADRSGEEPSRVRDGKGWEWRVAREFLAAFEGGIPENGNLIHGKKGRECLVVEFPDGTVPGSVVVKRHRPRVALEHIKYAFQPTRAMAEWRNARALESAGVAVARALALGELRRFGLWFGSDLVMERVLPGTTLREYLDAADRGDGPCRALVLDLAAQVARFHAAGYHYRDLHVGNILVAEDGTARLIDLHEPRRAYRDERRVAVDDLARLNSSARVPGRARVMFLKRYMSLRGWDPRGRKELALEIDAATKAIWSRHLRKHGTRIETYGVSK
ncbi:MAG: glycosyltransferase [Lentisphaerae bacterium]|nr:glycosyltransferase [Lentisphaerota bacterium]